MTEPQFARLLRAAQAAAPRVDLGWLPPANSDWPMSRDALQFIAAIVQSLRPERVVEFGAGLSTTVISHTARESSLNCRICSIEHDPAYFETVCAELGDFIAAGKVECRLAPLVTRLCAERWLPVYCDRQPPPFGHEGAQLIIVDGPPQSLGGREGVLYQALEYAEAGAIMLIDDADRPDLVNALRRWRENLGWAVELTHLSGFKRGLAAALVLRPVKRDQLEPWRSTLTVDELARAIPAPYRFALIDEGRLVLPPDLAARRMTFHETGDWPPASEEAAVDCLTLLRGNGCAVLAIAWPSFWWLEHYSGLPEFCGTNAKPLAQNARICIFSLLGDDAART